VANNFANPNWVALRILWFLENMLEVAKLFNDTFETEFKRPFPVGSSFSIKLPQSWLVGDGLGYDPQGINRLVTTINLDKIKHIHFEWDSYEKLVKMERSEKELDESYFEPAARQLAQQVDSDAALFAYQNASNVFGTLGTDATTLSPYTAAERRLYEKACPEGERVMAVSPSLMEAFVKNNVTQFNPTKEISDMFRKGVVGTAAGSTWYRSNSLYKHTAGTAATHSTTVTGAGQSGSSLSITGTNADTIKVGDKFSIASVNGVNPRTRRAGSMGAQHFTVTSDLTLTAGPDTLNFLPSIYGPGSQYQNVDALPGNAAALTWWPGTASPSGAAGLVSLLITKYAFAVAYGKFEVPKAVEDAQGATDPETGCSMRFVRAWDQKESKMTNRYDMCYGFGNLYQDNGAVAIAGA